MRCDGESELINRHDDEIHQLVRIRSPHVLITGDTGYGGGRLDVVVNIAGYELVGAFKDLSADEMERAAWEHIELPTEFAPAP